MNRRMKMDELCVFCRKALRDGRCMNPECYSYTENMEYRPSSELKQPPTLRERRRQIYESARRPLPEDAVEELYEPEVFAREQTEDEFFPYAIQTDPETGEVLQFEEHKEEGQEPIYASTTERTATVTTTRIVLSKEQEKPTRRESPTFTESAWLRLYYFVNDYLKEPGRVVTAAARKRDAGIGVILILVTLCLSAIGTLLFGIMYLDDFFTRWIGCGFFAPILAYGLNLLYGWLHITLGSARRERIKDPSRGAITFRELFAAATVSSVLPTLLLFLSCFLAPLDKSMRIFQFFALLITVAWIVSLLFSMFTVYGGGFTIWNLLLAVVFVLFAFLIMRALWVWFIMGDFRFALHIPLSAFLEG